MHTAIMTDGPDAESWDAYVKPRTATVSDLFAWRHIAREAYGMRSHFLGAFEGSQLVGVLGLFEVKHWLFGHHLTTAPFANDGGLHADSPDIARVLVERAKQIADELDVEYLLIRTRGVELDGFVQDQRYCTAVIDLKGGSEHVWKKLLPSKTRNHVRRGQKECFDISSGMDEIESFYDVFHQHMRDLGSPAHGMRYYRLIAQYLAQRASFIVVRDGRNLVAGALLVIINDTAMTLHTVALKQYNRQCPNYLIYWHMIETAIRQGCTRFDMGRSIRDSTHFHFKENWNPSVIPLTYNYYLRKLTEVPFMDPRNPRYRLPIAAWRRLPLLLTKALGPRFISGLA